MEEMQIQALDLLLDDHFALWDFADTFPAFRPDANDSRVDDLIDLVRSGLVAVTFGKWFENDTAPVALESAEAALRNPSVWKPNGKEPGYVVELTEKGIAHLRKLGIGLPDR
jgi:hypothetical protein